MNVRELKEAIKDLPDDMLVAMNTQYGPAEATFEDTVEVSVDSDGVLWAKEERPMWHDKPLKVFLLGW